MPAALHIVRQCRYCLRVADGSRWVTLMTLLQDYGIAAEDVYLVESYCAPCAHASEHILNYGPLGSCEARGRTPAIYDGSSVGL